MNIRDILSSEEYTTKRLEENRRERGVLEYSEKQGMWHLSDTEENRDYVGKDWLVISIGYPKQNYWEFLDEMDKQFPDADDSLSGFKSGYLGNLSTVDAWDKFYGFMAKRRNENFISEVADLLALTGAESMKDFMDFSDSLNETSKNNI